ncbi:acetylornithine deacetylase (plasmid) [Photobacterium sp. GJ3]|uniref:acetylornithine deacetylase n=1 Tax=Photobacterium sp. GJ3 TaxID=2829502 RepID=UPI001B8AFCD1|nr:acetylornithine deacetylase [Photobacterium sp. GJ3]QUJ70232.1 acetylornithine deacetylase [Photobacterium sp. GJ3]
MLSYLSILQKLISFDSTSSKSNLDLIDWIQAFLSEHDINPTIIYNQEKTKANLFAHIGPEKEGGIVLSGHTDVVPAVEPDWNSNPFEMSIRDGLVYGRGTCDMKGFIAVVLYNIAKLNHNELTAPLYLIFSYDEEVGCIGIHSALDYLRQNNIHPDLAIIGEPSMMNTINGHKGKISVQCHVKGTCGHSSDAPNQVNAIEYAAKAIVKISEQAERFKTEGPYDHDYTVPHNTMLTTMISGGVATNITPEDCAFRFEIRHLPETQPLHVLQKLYDDIDTQLTPGMKAVDPKCGFTWRTQFNYPGMSDACSSDAFMKLNPLFSKPSGKVSYGTEGGSFESINGIPSIICGPGSINEAHKPNEYISLEQLERCDEFVQKLFRLMSTPG